MACNGLSGKNGDGVKDCHPKKNKKRDHAGNSECTIDGENGGFPFTECTCVDESYSEIDVKAEEEEIDSSNVATDGGVQNSECTVVEENDGLEEE